MNYRWMPMFLLTILFAAAFMSSGCQKKDETSGGGVVATTPNTPCNIPGNTNCTPSSYQYQGSAWYVPGVNQWGYNTNNGFCGCPFGYSPFYSGQLGFACLPNTYVSSNYGQYNMLYFQAQNGQMLNIPQNYYPSNNYSGWSNSSSEYYCSQGAGLSCDVRVAGTCPSGGTCQPRGGGSTIGICIYNQTQQTVANNGCWRSNGSNGWYFVCNWGTYNNTYPTQRFVYPY